MSNKALTKKLNNYMQELVVEDVLHASGREEVYGCLFGRDSAITILKLLNIYEKDKAINYLTACRKTLLTHTRLQGKEVNIESGEQPGKFLHEYRPSNYERLLTIDTPWYVYPGEGIKNYDSLDSTPLILIAMYRYYTITKDVDFLIQILPSVEAGLNWIISYGDSDKDLLLEYELPKERKHGGLKVQSWTDSTESLRRTDGSFPLYPIAPVEVQGIAWLALRLWGNFYKDNYSTYHNPSFGKKLLSHASDLKKRFNETFIISSEGLYYAAQALDGEKKQIKTITANPLMCLWSAHITEDKTESIVDDKYIDDFIKRGLKKDMFVLNAGIRTMSERSPTFNPNDDSYHNGCFWPVLNSFVIEGLQNFKYYKEAESVKKASLTPILYFNSPIELYIEKNGDFFPYKNQEGQISCFNQAWSCAAALDWITS